MEPLTIKDFIDIVSKSFTLNHRSCAVCEHLPMEKVCEATLDILFNRRTLADMQRHYTQFADAEYLKEKSVLGEHRFRHHRDKCCKDKLVFNEDDLRKLGLLDDEAELLQRMYNLKYEDAMKPDVQKTEVRRQRYHNLGLFNAQRNTHQSNVDLLAQGLLPDTLQGTHQPQSGSCLQCGFSFVKFIDYGLLLRQESVSVLSLTKQIDVILSDIEKNNIAADKAAKGGDTTVIQVMNTSIADMENKFRLMMRNVKSSLDILLPHNPEVVQQVFNILRNCINADVVPVLEKTKEVLQIEK